jgi:hypothetical protein
MIRFNLKSQYIHLDRCSFILVWLEDTEKTNTILNISQLQELTIGWSSDHKALVKKMVFGNYQYEKVIIQLMYKVRNEFTDRLKVITYYCGSEYENIMMKAIEAFIRSSLKLALEIASENKDNENNYPNFN